MRSRVLLASITMALVSSHAMAGPEEPLALPRVSTYASLAEAIAARDLYGALEFPVPPILVLDEASLPETEALGSVATRTELEDPILIEATSPYLQAAGSGCPEIVARFLRVGQPVAQVNVMLENAMHLAARAGDVYTIEVLERANLSALGYDSRGYLPVHVAAEKGEAEVFQALLYHDPFVDRPTKEDEPLQLHHVALYAGQYEITRLARLMGIVMNVRRMAVTGDVRGVLEVIAEDPPLLEAVDGGYNTPLMNAIVSDQPEMVTALLDAGAHIEAVNMEGRTPLGIAVYKNRLHFVRQLVERGASMRDQRDGHTEQSLLGDAVENGTDEMVKLLVELGAPLEIKDVNGFTPLHRAIQMKRMAKAKILLDGGAEISTQENQGKSLLHTAIEVKSMDMAILSLEEGIDTEIRDLDRRTPLHIACKQGLGAVFDLLVSYNARPNPRDNKDMSPLLYAAAGAKTDLLRRLMAMGADINARDSHGRTALHHAVIAGGSDATDFLLTQGADANAADEDGRPPLYYALFDEKDGLARLLVQKGAKIDYRMPNGRSMLYVPMHQNQPQLAGWLVENGLPVVDADNEGWTPLHQAAAVGTEFTIEMLLGAGADVNALDKHGKSPLHVASARGHILVVKALATGGADLTQPDANGWLPIHHSAYRGHWGPIQFFVLRGVELDTPLPDGRLPLHLSVESGMMRTVLLMHGKNSNLLHQDGQGRTPLALAEELRVIPDINVCRSVSFAERELASQMTHNYLRIAYSEFLDSLLASGDTARLARLLELHPNFANLMFLGWTPLQRAVRLGNAESIKVLLEAGADPALLDENGLWQTPLHLAAAASKDDMALLLVEGHPELLSITDAFDKTPEELAREAGNEELAKKLHAPSTS